MYEKNGNERRRKRRRKTTRRKRTPSLAVASGNGGGVGAMQMRFLLRFSSYWGDSISDWSQSVGEIADEISQIGPIVDDVVTSATTGQICRPTRTNNSANTLDQVPIWKAGVVVYPSTAIVLVSAKPML